MQVTGLLNLGGKLCVNLWCVAWALPGLSYPDAYMLHMYIYIYTHVCIDKSLEMAFPATKRTVCNSSHCRFVFILSFYGTFVVLCLVFW